MQGPLWAMIHCGLSGSTVSLSYRDALGHRHDRLTAGTLDAESRTIFVPSESRWVRTIQEDLERISGEARHSVPVFVETARTHADIDWERMLGTILDPAEVAEVAFVRKTPSEGVATSSTHRRLVIAKGVELDSEVDVPDWTVVGMGGASWAAHGGAGVALVRAQDLAGELRRLSRIHVDNRPNLVIPYGSEARKITRAGRPPKGVALMAIETDQPTGPVQDVLEGIETGTIMDIAKRRGVLLAADPVTLIGLNAMSAPSVGSTSWPNPIGGKEAVARESGGGRRLDAELKPVGEDGVVAEALVVGSPVVSGTRYRLGVRIGEPYDRTVLTTPPPPIEESLPTLNEPVDLEVGVFGDGFRVEGWSVGTLRLPTRGPTSEISFIVVAPVVAAPTQAGFDLSLRFQGNVAQQFKLTATVFPADASGRGDLRLVLTFSRATADESGGLGRRALSISTETRADGTQRMLIWGPGTDHRELSLLLVNSFMTGFHDILNKAFWLNGQPRWEETYPVGRPSADFDETIRKLAHLGDQLKKEVLTRLPPENQSKMRELAQSEHSKIQVVRDEEAAALPWAALYDYPVPDKEDAPVCVGRHDGQHPDSQAFCIKGFWGVRHIIEEVLRSPARRAEPPYERPSQPQAVLVSLDELNLYTQEVVAALREASGFEISPFEGDGDELVDRFWATDPRVAIAVLLGHVELDASAGMLAPARLALPQGRRFSTGAFADRFLKVGTWTPAPGPLVMVLGCTTGPVDLGSAATLTSDFLNAGSPWAVGTCAAITEAMASDLAHKLAAAVFANDSVGHAMRAWREEVLQAGNPIAFACTAVGDVDTGFASVVS
jgi:hypothetical protein